MQHSSLKNTALILFLLLFGFHNLHAQDARKLKKLGKSADKNLAKGNIYTASDQYEEILAKDSSDMRLQYNLAMAYYQARDYQSALRRFKAVRAAAGAEFPEAMYYEALMLKMNGEYTEARKQFQLFAKQYKPSDPLKAVLKKWAKIEADGCAIASSESGKDDNLRFEHLGREVNSNYTDLSPAWMGDTSLMFASIRSDTILVAKPGEDPSVYLMKLFRSSGRDYTFSNAKRVTAFDIPGKHIANPSYSADGELMCYTLCEDADKKINCRIVLAEHDNGQWNTGVDAGEEVNLDRTTSTHPFIAKNKAGQYVLYFASDRAGGRGGMDIWYAIRKKDGSFMSPRNLGFKINSDRDEATPFYDEENAVLYFSSNGWIGSGGYDVFRCPGEPGKFNVIENLGAPFNSSCDDMYYRHRSGGTAGYLVSNRPGIFSVKGPTCCDDVFAFAYQELIQIAVTGYAYDEADPDVSRIEGAAVQLMQKTENEEIRTGLDTCKGRDFFFTLKADKSYKLMASADGYFAGSVSFETDKKSDTIFMRIPLRKLEKNKAYRLNNIYYDFDKADLRPESEKVLDSLYVIMLENPRIIIELSSHTDSRGSDAYNLNLSQKRAESCVNYMIQRKGLDPQRISAKGYGETKPIQDCSAKGECPQDNTGDCDCHQLNRRTEFRITGELDGTLLNEE